jgi:putative protease
VCSSDLTPSQPVKYATGDSVFLIGKDSVNTYIKTDINTGINTNINNTDAPFNIKPTRFPAKRIADSLTPQRPPSVNTDGNVNQNQPTKPVLWFKADNAEWLDIISATPCRRLIFDADISKIEALIDTPAAVKTWRSRISVALPPFIEEPRLVLWQGIIDKCVSVGIRSFTVSNIGHIPLVKHVCNGAGRIVADSLLWCMNRFTRAELSEHGVDESVFSWEDEYLNIRDNVYPPATATGGGMLSVAPVYGRPPLFISRMKPAIDAGETAVDPHGNAFVVSTKNGLYYTLPVTPVCLFAKRKKLSECGVSDFLIDVSFHEPDYRLMNTLINGFKDGVRIGDGTIFNFKAGLR